MRTGPDTFLVAKPGKESYARHLWQKQRYLLLANRLRLNLTPTSAVYSEDPILGSAFVPVRPLDADPVRISKA